jgi:riboflavin biosynthesis pyrimidine reductase
VRFRRLLPDAAEVDAADQLAGLGLGERAPAGRPWVVANFVMAADGRAAFRGESAPLGSDGDREVFHRLRTQVDAVLAGTGTVATETYNRLARQAERRAQREADGLAADPWLLQVTRSGSVPWEAPLFRDPAQPVLVLSGEEVRVPDGVTAPVTVEGVAGGSLAAALEVARRRHGIASVLCEGGPRVLAALLAEGCVDELFLTLAPRLTGGGDEPGVTEGPLLPDPAGLDLVWALERDGFLFLRYAVA